MNENTIEAWSFLTALENVRYTRDVRFRNNGLEVEKCASDAMNAGKEYPRTESWRQDAERRQALTFQGHS